MNDIADNKLQEVNKIIQDYITKVGINIVSSDDNISHYFNMTSTQLRKMTSEECEIAAMLLNQKSTQIQMEINYHNRIRNWANENINSHVVDKLKRFGDQYTKYEAKRMMAIQETDYTKKLHQIVRTSQAYLDALEYIPMSIKNHADLFINLAKSKRRIEGN
jgi:hypothetical protein